MVNSVIKRILDIVVAAMLLLVLLPAMALISGLILLSMGRPVLFIQTRIGFRDKPFGLFKFRTMSFAAGPDGRLLPDAQRITRVGRFLRRWSLDELPQLWNVLKGEMSLVGPRPLLPEYLERYSPEQRRRHEVKPGITGWAQIHGRNAQTWQERLKMDVWYVDNANLWLDIRILATTLIKVLLREGITHDPHETMPKFMRDGEVDVNHRQNKAEP